MKALATAQIEAQQIKDEAHEDSKATGAQDFDLQIENMSKVGCSLTLTCKTYRICYRCYW